MSLTKHQRRILAALDRLDQGREWDCGPGADGWFTRYDLGCVVYAASAGVQLRSLQILRAAGLVRAESELVVGLVKRGVCRCGCDRWRLTEEGSKLVAGWKVVELPRPEPESW